MVYGGQDPLHRSHRRAVGLVLIINWISKKYSLESQDRRQDSAEEGDRYRFERAQV